jgi:uncharacterized membrane protein
MANKNAGSLPGFVGWLILIIVVCAVVLPIGIPLWIALSAKSYDFPEVRIDATVQPDGSIDLVEKRTFDFDGQFSFAFFTISEPPQMIQGFTVREGDRQIPFADESSYEFKARWNFAAEDEQRTFTISYRVLCAVDVWADTAHLDWQFIGTGWEVPTDHAFIRVHLPEAAANPKRIERPISPCTPAPSAAPAETRPLAPGETLAWGHGPLGGDVRVPDPQTVTFEISDLPEFTFVEGSIVFPETAVPLSYQTPAEFRETIVAIEAEAAETANAERRVLLAEEAQRDARRRFLWFLMAGVVVAFILLVLIARLRDRVRGVPKILQSPPEDIHPVELAQMWAVANGTLGMSNVYRTQMLHLARVGAIELQAVGHVTDPKDFRVRLRDMKDVEPRDVEFLEFLFPKSTDDDIGLSSLKPTGQRKTELREWWKLVDSSGKSVLRGLLPSLRWESLTTTLLGIGAVAAGGLMAGLIQSPVGLLLIPVGLIGMTIAHILIKPRIGEQGRERMAKWRAFRRFLTEFSSLPEAPTMAVVIWEQYLVYATALGVADQVEKQVKALIPPEELPSPWQGAPSGVNALSFVHSFNTVPVHSAASVAPPSTSTSSGIGSFSSSSGGGGGFSGGGGGGGGGTGGGAG